MDPLPRRGRRGLHGAASPPRRARHRAAGALGLRRPAGADRMLSGRRAHHLGRDPPHHAEPARRGADARLMRRFLLVTLLAIAIALLVTRAEPLAPPVAAAPPGAAVGRGTPLVGGVRGAGPGP